VLIRLLNRPENIFVSAIDKTANVNTCLLGDVGHSRDLGTGILASTVSNLGTYRRGLAERCALNSHAELVSRYNPPELRNQDPQKPEQHTRRVDIYQLGCTLFLLLIYAGPHRAPVIGKDPNGVAYTAGTLILENMHFSNPYWEAAALRDGAAGPQRADFIKKTMARNPEKRGRARELLMHPWISQALKAQS